MDRGELSLSQIRKYGKYARANGTFRWHSSVSAKVAKKENHGLQSCMTGVRLSFRVGVSFMPSDSA